MIRPSPHIEYDQLPFLFATEELSLGRRMIIVAEAEKGELYSPVTVSSLSRAETLFGSGPLINLFKDFFNSAKASAYLMRMERNAFQDVYRTLIKFPMDLIYVDGLLFDGDAAPITEYIQFAKDKEDQGQLIHGFISMQAKTMDDIRKNYPLIKALEEYSMDGTKSKGKFMSVVCNQVDGKNAALTYAGLVSSLSPEISPVNKTIPIDLDLEFTKDEILELSENGFVCFKSTVKKGNVCTSSTCAVSDKDSASKYLSNLRIAQYLIQSIGDQLREYIGRVGMAYTMMEVEDRIKSILDTSISLSHIKRYAYELDAIDLEGLINIEIEIVPIFSVYAMAQHSQVRVRN